LRFVAALLAITAKTPFVIASEAKQSRFLKTFAIGLKKIEFGTHKGKKQKFPDFLSSRFLMINCIYIMVLLHRDIR